MRTVLIMTLLALSHFASAESQSPKCIFEESGISATLDDENAVFYIQFPDAEKPQPYWIWANVGNEKNDFAMLPIEDRAKYSALGILLGETETGDVDYPMSADLYSFADEPEHFLGKCTPIQLPD